MLKSLGIKTFEEFKKLAGQGVDAVQSLGHASEEVWQGLAKGIGELATSPGHLADLITGNKGFSSNLSPEQIAQQKQALAPTNRYQKFGHGIGSLNPGTEFLTPGLEKAGLPGGMAFGIGLGVDVVTPGPGEFKGFDDLTTKILDKLKGKTKVSKQFISDLTNMPELKQAERDLIRKSLEDVGDEVNVSDFANKVKTELLPLKKISAPKGSTRTSRYESIVLPNEFRGPVANYSEHIYDSPIKTSAGDVHFADNQFVHSNDPNDSGLRRGTQNYFAHVRTEEMAQGYLLGRKKVFRDIEWQSDLFQKGRLEGESAQAREIKSNPTYALENRKNFHNPEAHDMINQQADQRLADVAKLEPYRNDWQNRIARERVKEVAQAGGDTLLVPTGETAMKIEGLGENNAWNIAHEVGSGGPKLTVDNIKQGQLVFQPNTGHWIVTDVLGDGKFKAVLESKLRNAIQEHGFAVEGGLGEKSVNYAKTSIPGFESLQETFDISGKVDTNNPIYKFYEKEVGRYLKNKYNAEMITDPQGVKWWQVNVPKEAGKQPIGAFGKGQIGTLMGMAGVTSLGIMGDEAFQSLKTNLSNKTIEFSRPEKPEFDFSKASQALKGHESRGATSPESTVNPQTKATGSSQITSIAFEEWQRKYAKDKEFAKSVSFEQLKDNPELQNRVTDESVRGIYAKYNGVLEDWPTKTAKLKAYKEEILRDFNEPIYWLAGEWVAGPNWVAKLDNKTAEGAKETVRDYIRSVGDRFRK